MCFLILKNKTSVFLSLLTAGPSINNRPVIKVERTNDRMEWGGWVNL